LRCIIIFAGTMSIQKYWAILMSTNEIAIEIANINGGVIAWSEIAFMCNGLMFFSIKSRSFDACSQITANNKPVMVMMAAYNRNTIWYKGYTVSRDVANDISVIKNKNARFTHIKTEWDALI
jgi:hypothetical protein